MSDMIKPPEIAALPPRCPVCAGPTAAREMHRLRDRSGYMCFYRCLTCGTDYPVAVAMALLPHPPTGPRDGLEATPPPPGDV